MDVQQLILGESRIFSDDYCDDIVYCQLLYLAVLVGGRLHALPRGCQRLQRFIMVKLTFLLGEDQFLIARTKLGYIFIKNAFLLL
jgi:hypothetical protein